MAEMTKITSCSNSAWPIDGKEARPSKGNMDKNNEEGKAENAKQSE